MIRVITILLLSMLSACSVISKPSQILPNRSTAYLDAKNLPSLKTPPGATPIKTETHLAIPERHDSEASKKINLTPPGL